MGKERVRVLCSAKKVSRTLLLLLVSLFLYFVAGLPQFWGDPEWFGRFPYAYTLRFFLALELYLCGVSFFISIYLIRIISGKVFHFLPVFTAAFALSLFFSVSAAAGMDYQFLRLFTAYSAAGLWFILNIVLFCSGRTLRLFILPLFFLVSVPLSLMENPFPFLAFCLRISALIVFIPIGGTVFTFADSRSNGAEKIAEQYQLSRRELEVLRQVLAGRGNNEIAETLFISLSTVKTHIASLFKKTGAKSRLELAALARSGEGHDSEAL
ncbi:helix-turn-helix transcriptional regulator [Treponema sp. OttesenSCG-928-L16]|nr:helix-turn-helix transcriptional regulator [Treponema sp. OttesenSCG-928-L16]